MANNTYPNVQHVQTNIIEVVNKRLFDGKSCQNSREIFVNISSILTLSRQITYNITVDVVPRNLSSRFSSNSEASDSELLENIKEIV